MLSYLDFLKALLAAGPKLATLWPKITAAIEAVKALVLAVNELIPTSTPPGTLSMSGLTPAEAEAETQIAHVIAGAQGAFDGTILRTVWEFLRSHPELLTWLLNLLSRGS